MAIVLPFLFVTSAYTQAQNQKTVLFICEHGSAKSVVAAAHFNRIAEKDGLPVTAICRGTNPDEVIPEKINKLLQGDGFPSHNGKPVRLTSTDLETADYVVAFSPVPSTFGDTQKVESWSIPSFEAGYPTARDSIIHNIERMIQRIKIENQK